MSNPNAKKQGVSYVAIDDLKTDYSYQRTLDEKRVKKIAKEFTPEIVGTIFVSRRKDGSLYIIDGNHRVAAMRAIGRKYVTATVFDGLSPTEEAELFRKLNTSQKKPSFNEVLNASITAGNEDAVAYKELLDMSGVKYSFGNNGVDKCFIAHNQGVLCVKRYGSQAFVDSLRLLNASIRRFDGSLVAGLSRVVYAYPGIRRDRLIYVLSVTPYEELVRVSSSFLVQFLGGGSTYICIAKAIITFYNKGLTARNRLDLSVLDKREVQQ